MKKLLFLLLPNIAIAQSYIAPNFTFAKTSIYNKEDVKLDLLPSTKAFAPAFGMNFGKQMKSVFFEIGIGYNPIVQKYKGWFRYPNDPNNLATATKKLNYLQIPLLIGKTFSKNKKVNPFIQGGINMNYLLKYSTTYHADYNSSIGQPPIGYINYTQSGNAININHGNVGTYANYQSSEWYFKKFVFGASLNFGFNYNLNSKFKVGVASINNISFTNPENNKKMDFIIENGNGDPLLMGLQSSFNPYERYGGIIGGRIGLFERGSSILISNGISISLKYFLNHQNN